MLILLCNVSRIDKSDEQDDGCRRKWHVKLLHGSGLPSGDKSLKLNRESWLSHHCEYTQYHKFLLLIFFFKMSVILPIIFFFS